MNKYFNLTVSTFDSELTICCVVGNFILSHSWNFPRIWPVPEVLLKAKSYSRSRHSKSPCCYWIFGYTFIWLTLLNSSVSKPMFSAISIITLAVYKMVFMSTLASFPFLFLCLFSSLLLNLLLSYCYLFFFSLCYFVLGKNFKDFFESIYMECFKIFLLVLILIDTLHLLFIRDIPLLLLCYDIFI